MTKKPIFEIAEKCVSGGGSEKVTDSAEFLSCRRNRCS